MYFVGDFFKGIGNCFTAFSLLFKKGLWTFLFFPLILWVAMWIVSFYGIIHFSSFISDWLRSFFSLETIHAEGHWLSFMKDYLLGIFSLLLSIALKILLWFIAGTFIKYLLLIFLSPVFALLSEKTETVLTGRTFPFAVSTLLKDIVRGITISFRNLLLEYAFIFICFVLTLLFPPLFVITSPFLLFVGWYYTGFTLLDYNCERHHLSGRDTNDLISRNKGYACAVGMFYSVMLALPFMFGGLIGIVFGPVIATIGGTLSFLAIAKKDGLIMEFSRSEME